jgi:DNA-binding Lrp family transcriptional regulator
MGKQRVPLSEFDRRLLDGYQHGLPLEPRPFARIADDLGVSEQAVLDALAHLQENEMVSRVGPVFRPNRVGVSTLAALAVPPDALTRVAGIVSAFDEVNHNYEREHRFNLWFVLTARDNGHLEEVLEAIAEQTGLQPLNVPMLEDYFIDLGFRLQWT